MLPTIQGLIKRRLLVNFRVDPARAEGLLPAGLRPQTVGGYAVVGVCLIRLDELRPVGVPALLGMSSENAAHRIAVEWDGPDAVRTGVYIPRRDTNSRSTVLLGGRLFPGIHQAAQFHVVDSDERVAVRLRSQDGRTAVTVAANVRGPWPAASIFPSAEAASSFFAKDTLGLSPRSDGSLEGIELEVFDWAVTPLHATRLDSSYIMQAFDGAAAFDNALLMRNIRHRWHEARFRGNTPAPGAILRAGTL